MNTAKRLIVESLAVARGRHLALHGLSGCFEPGSLTAVVGPNGAGKSTLLKALMGLLPPCHGRVIGPPRAALAYLPQASAIDRSFPLTIGEAVAMGAWRRIGAFGALGRGELRRRVATALEAVRLDGLAGRSIGALSAGQFQRVLFARLLMQEAEVILLDEPFTGVDAATTRDLLALVGQWHAAGRTVIAVLHDLEQVRAHFPHTLLLAREPIGWGESARVLSVESLQRALAMGAEMPRLAALPR